MRPPIDARAAAGFADAAEAYELGRPGYPAAAIAAVASTLGLVRGSRVVDLAAGTGKLTEALAARFPHVVAIEPLGPMRAVLAAKLPGVEALDGVAEEIPLDDGAADVVTVGEAFHWFDHERALAEIARVLRPGGGVAVLRNHGLRDPSTDPWTSEFGEVVARVQAFDPRAEDGHLGARGDWRARLDASPLFGPTRDALVAHEQRLDRVGFRALMRSWSSIGALPVDRRERAVAELDAVLERHGVHEVVTRYQTAIVVARLAAAQTPA